MYIYLNKTVESGGRGREESCQLVRSQAIRTVRFVVPDGAVGLVVPGLVPCGAVAFLQEDVCRQITERI